jgi:hypothetical protein
VKTAALIEAILRMMSAKVPHETNCHHYLRAAQVAPVVLRQLAVEKSDLSPLLVVAQHGNESSWRWSRQGNTTYRKGRAIIVGEHGEVGWAQIKPDGRATMFCADLDIRRPDGNVACQIRLLEEARRGCGGEPANWLGRYRGDPCGPSDYAQRVLAIMARAVPPVALTDIAVVP